MQEFTLCVEGYKTHMDNLTATASLAKAEGEEEGEVTSKMADLQHRYDNLCSLPLQRREILEDYLPTVQQYESSRGAWLDLLSGWEDKMDQLAPPMATPISITIQVDEMKVSVA